MVGLTLWDMAIDVSLLTRSANVLSYVQDICASFLSQKKNYGKSSLLTILSTPILIWVRMMA